LVYSILLNIPIINYHPMNLLPASSTLNSNPNIADLFTKPLPRHQFDTLIGDTTTITPATSVAPTLVASVPTATPVSDSVPSLPIVLDTGASFSRTPFASAFLPVAQAPYGLFRSAASLVSDSDSKLTSVASKVASTPVDPYTLITGEGIATASDIAFASDLSSPDTADNSDSGSSLKVHFDVREFGTASLIFLFSPNWSLIKVFVEPTQVDWLHWVPLPRLTPTESYFHICGRDYLQAFVLLHLIPIWITLVSALLRSD